MRLQTLDEFLETAGHDGFPRNAYVTAPGFKELYVRRGKRRLNGEWVEGVLDLARVETTRKGRGTFTALITDLLKRGIPLYVECVMNQRFVKKLVRLGFIQVGCVEPPSFFKLPGTIMTEIQRIQRDPERIKELLDENGHVPPDLRGVVQTSGK